MTNLNKRGQLRYLIHACIATSIALPLVAQAQDDDIEEVVVTGSYIRNSAFANDANIDTVTTADLFEAGSSSMSNYIRDLTYTQNTNVVASVLASNDGSQNSVGGSFNLRGLGENSTLQLVDGIRSINSSINNALPELAIDRMEIVLDGGSATYGSDAVAGVVNMLAIKEFDGFRARTYYQRTEDGAMEDYTASMLWGKTFDNGIGYVGAFDYKRATPMMMADRPREWSQSAASSTSGNPGAFRIMNNADPGVNLNAFHNGTSSGGNLVDPACGLVPGNPHGTTELSTPSGVLTDKGRICRYEYTNGYPYRQDNDDYLMYNSFTYEVADWLELNFSAYNSFRIGNAYGSPSTGTSSNSRKVLLVRADHPANPFGADVSPWNWRPLTNSTYNMAFQPRHLNGNGSRDGETVDSNGRYVFRANFDLTDTWAGYAYYANADRKIMSDSHTVHLGKMQLGLAGLGGATGDKYWNPFGSADPRSPLYVEGVTSNDLEMTDWPFDHNYNRLSSRNSLDIWETAFNGEVLDLPAGALLAAFGFQVRDVVEQRFADPLDAIGHDYNTAVGTQLPTDKEYFSETRAIFAELEVPILEGLDMQVAVRHEQFVDFGLKATTPKVALRWEATPELALRVSWGESFLAPTPTQARPFIRNENCTETFSGTDFFTDFSLTGSTRCSSGNPNLAPETSEITNLGFTWQPSGDLDGLEISVDYQEVEYVDRIRTLTGRDTILNEFNKFLGATGLTEATYDFTPGSPTRLQAESWYAKLGGTSAVDRFGDFEVNRLFLQSANISSVFIDLFDTKVSYDWSTQDWGSFRSSLSLTGYLNYEYEGLTGGLIDALGVQNDQSGIAPPLPEYKANVRLNWFRGNQSASISANYWSDVDTDGRTVDRYSQGWVMPDKIDGELRINLQYAHVLNGYFNSEFTLAAGVTNLTNEKPTLLPVMGGFESRLSTPWHRQFWVSIDWTPGG
jgi:iron complex outermembrane receptor protein